MKTKQFLIIIIFIAFLAGCATVAPNELVNARSAYQHASQGPAARLVPAELYKAHEALILAEKSFLEESDSYKTKDLAYVAQRKSEQAVVLAAMAADKASKDKANADFQKEQAAIVKQAKQDLIDSEKQTAQAQAEIDKQAALKEAKDKADADFQMQQDQIMKQRKQDLIESEQRAAEAKAELDRQAYAQAQLDKQQAEIMAQRKQDLIDSEKRAADALAELAKIAAVKEEERGMVITLSGSVLFRSAQSTLLPTAQDKLDQVSKALLAVRAHKLIVEGHTDSRGSESYNQGLSQRRADAVRSYLVHKGYPADRIQTRGMSESNPIADNASPEGRANNRRVEIVIERLQSSNP